MGVTFVGRAEPEHKQEAGSRCSLQAHAAASDCGRNTGPQMSC